MVTIYDIARLSGVSKSTVSRVISNQSYVSAETKHKVLKVMQEHNYVPNSLAKQFRQRKTKCIAILIPDLHHPYFSELVRYISAESYKNGFKTVVHQTFSDKNVEREVYTQLQKKEFDALILTSSALSEKEIDECTRDNLVVACNENYDGDYFDVFCLNEEEVTMAATSHLLSKGFTKLGFCSDNISSPLQQARLKGFILAHNKKGLDYNIDFLFNEISTIEDGIILGEKLFKDNLELDGILAGSDFVAAGLIRSAVRYNIQIPQQLSIVGFDNHPISLVTNPQISTICNRLHDMSIDLVNHIVNKVNGVKQTPIKMVYTGEFITRNSS